MSLWDEPVPEPQSRDAPPRARDAEKSATNRDVEAENEGPTEGAVEAGLRDGEESEGIERDGSDGTDRGGARQSVRGGDLSNSNIQMAGTLFNVAEFVHASGETTRALSRRDFESLSLGSEHVHLIEPEHEIASVLRSVEERRFVVVVGERGLGKGALCRLAAERLATHDPRIGEALFSSSFDSSVRWEPDRWFGKQGDYAGTVVVFEDLLDHPGSDLRGFFDRLDSTRLAGLASRLSQSGSYLIVSTDRDCLRVSYMRLERLGILCEVSPPDEEELIGALYRRVERWCSDPRSSDREGEARALLDDRAAELVRRLRTLPRTIRFADELLIRVVEGDLTLEKAVETLDDLESWLLEDLARDRTKWSFVLALVLASIGRRERWVPWLLFHRLWRQVEAALDAEQRWWRDDETRPLERMVVDETFLASVRAEVRSRPYPDGHGIRFADPKSAGRLWRVLSGPGRAVLATLVPILSSWVQSGHEPLRRLGARALGRVGEIAPAHLVLPFVSDQLGSDRGDPLLAETLLGAVTSDDPVYVAGCLDQLHDVLVNLGPRERKARAIRALVPIGVSLPTAVLDLLDRLLSRRLKGAGIELATEKDRLNSVGTTGESPLTGKALEEVTVSLLDDDTQLVLWGCRYVLIGLCFGGRSPEVWAAMSAWLERDAPKITPWIALLSLAHFGVFSTVERHPVQAPRLVPNEDRDRPDRCSRVLVALSAEEEIDSLARFLELSYTRCAVLPSGLRTDRRRFLLDRLESWSLDAARFSALREPVQALFRRLLESPEEPVRHEVFGVLRRLSRDRRREKVASFTGELLRTHVLE